MKTLPQGCRQDPVSWWDEELPEAITERTRLKKIRDLPASDEIHEIRQLQYREQAAIVQQLILSKRKATLQSLLRTTSGIQQDQREQRP